jgi:hypothetical protein
MEIKMATLSEMNLARMLDKMGGDLANDLEWALEQLMRLKEYVPQSTELATRYVEAQRHLNSRRAYEAACGPENRHP